MTRPLDFFRYRNGSLCAGGTDLAEIAAAVGTPAYVYSAAGLLRPLRELQQGLAPLRESTLCYAVKSCSNIAVLKLLGDAGGVRHGGHGAFLGLESRRDGFGQLQLDLGDGVGRVVPCLLRGPRRRPLLPVQPVTHVSTQSVQPVSIR